MRQIFSHTLHTSFVSYDCVYCLIQITNCKRLQIPLLVQIFLLSRIHTIFTPGDTMQLHQLIEDTRSANPKIEDETMSEYLERTYHLALMAWENIAETDKQPDSDTTRPLPMEPVAKIVEVDHESAPPVVPIESTEAD